MDEQWDELTEVALRARRGDAAAATAFVRATQTDVWRVCAHLGSLAVTDQALERQSIVAGASIYPFVHNLLLAATNEGLGAVLTTIVSRAEADLRPVLGIPDGHAIAALLGIGFPVKRITKLTRDPVEKFVTVDRFDGPTFTP